MANAFRAGFHLVAHRALPLPVGSSDRVVRSRHFSAACSLGKCPRTADRMFNRALAWQECPISRDRMIEINQMTLAYFRSQFPSSWGQAYLADWFGQDLTDDPRFRSGQALAGWTGLINHLRSRGVTAEEMTAAGTPRSHRC